MSSMDKEVYKFGNDAKRYEKAIKRAYNKQDAANKKHMKAIESQIRKLQKARNQEIERISKSRWEKIAGGHLQVNYTEGKVRINQREVPFSSIKGAEINVVYGCRFITKETGKSKKRASFGGAIVGGMIAGPIGAVAGGSALGKTKTESNSITNQITTCSHLGVLVNIDGFVSEIVLIINQVDKSSLQYSNAQVQAQTIISQLGVLSKTPVPQSCLLPHEEVSVKNIDAQINKKQLELHDVIEERTAFEQREANRKEARRQERSESGTATGGVLKKVGVVVYKIVFWAISAFVLLFCIASFMTTGGLASGILFLIAALAVNPFAGDLINKKLFKFPKWAALVILFVGFMAGLLVFPV